MWFLRTWIPLAIAVTGLCGLVLVTVQQNYRQSLNDPQIQMAEDGAVALARGDVPASLVQRGISLIDADKSLASWIAVYDNTGTPLESSAVLDGAAPEPPHGVFEALGSSLSGANDPKADIARRIGQNRISWQPREGVRIALVVIPVEGKDMFVVAGRNMREVENRESDLSFMVALAWLVILVATFVATGLGFRVTSGASKLDYRI